MTKINGKIVKKQVLHDTTIDFIYFFMCHEF